MRIIFLFSCVVGCLGQNTPELTHSIVWLLSDDHVATDVAGRARISGKLAIDPMNMEARLDDLNVVMGEVPRELLTFKPHWLSDTHMFGIGTGPETIPLTLTCDESFEGVLNGTGHSDVYETKDGFNQWHRWFPRWHYNKEKEIGPFQPVSTLLDIKLSNFSLGNSDLSFADSTSLLNTPENGIVNATVLVKIIVWINPSREQRHIGLIPARIVVHDLVQLQVVVVPHPDEADNFPWDVRFERELCIQPVRLNYSTDVCIKWETYQESRVARVPVRRRRWWGWTRTFAYSVQYQTKYRCVQHATGLTGAEFDLGRTPASIEWEKVNIRLKWKPIKTVDVVSQSFIIVPVSADSTSAYEEKILHSEHGDECVEVFFIQEFNPSDSHGDGVGIWNPGTVSAKAIIAGNRITCNQSTLLANAIGHVLGLKKPGNDSGIYRAGTPGTVMCEPGEAGSPTRNSVENGLNVHNPLLKWSVSFPESETAEPDCGGDRGSCGTCEDHAGDGCE